MRALPVIATMLGALAAGMATFAALYHHRRVRGAASVGVSALWIVSAAFGGAFAAFTATASVTQTLATPGTPVPGVPAPTATADTSAASITIDWADVDDADDYDIRRQVSGGGFSSLVTDLVPSTYTDAPLGNGTTYGYQVRVCNSGGCSAWSSTTSALTLPAVPSPSATADTSAADITVDWADVTGADDYDIERQVSGGGFSSLVTDLVPSTYTDPSLSNGTTYGYQVRACNATACSAWSSTTSALTVPAVPSAPSLTPSYRSISVSHATVTGATSYDLQRNVGAEAYSDLASDVSNPYADSVLSDNTTYGYKVRACNATGCSAYSAAATADTAPAIPTLSGTVSGLSSNLSWNAPSGASTYQLALGVTNSAPDRVDTFNRTDSSSSLGTMSDSTGPWAADAGTWGISTNQAYLATNSGGNNFATVDTNSPDGYVQFTLGANAPNFQGVAFRYRDAGNFLYLWTAPSFATWGVNKVVNGVSTQIGNTGLAGSGAGDVARVEYEGATIRVYLNGDLTTTITDATNSGYTRAGLYAGSAVTSAARWENFSAGQLPTVTTPITGLSGTTYSDSNLRIGASYQYTVAACNAAGTCSQASSSVSGLTRQTAPLLTATAAGSTQINLSFTTASVFAGTHYAEWGWRTVGGSWTDTLVTGQSASKSGLSANTKYEFRVRGCYVHISVCANPSPWTTQFATTSATAAPSAPTGVTGTAGSGAVAVSWTAPSGNVTNYRVHAYLAGVEIGGSPKTTNSTQTSYVYTGLTIGNTYTFAVDATNASGTSSLSTASADVLVGSTSERIAPDGVLASSNLNSPTVTPIQDDPDNYTAPDTTSLNGTSTTALTSLRVSFPTPTGTLTGDQEFNVYVKKRNNSGFSTNAVLVLRLYENGSLISSSAARTVTSTASSGLYSYTWDAATVTNAANVELLLEQTGNANVTMDIYAVEWNAATINGFTTPNAPTAVSASVTGLSGEATVSWNAPSAVTAGVTNYRVIVYSAAGGDPVGVIDWLNLTREVGSTTTSYRFNGLKALTSYTFKVQAYNAGGWGTLSSASGSVTINV